jgi:hypothetical protein
MLDIKLKKDRKNNHQMILVMKNFRIRVKISKMTMDKIKIKKLNQLKKLKKLLLSPQRLLPRKKLKKMKRRGRDKPKQLR